MNLVQRAASLLRRSFSSRPSLAAVLGSGFDGVLEGAEVLCEIPFRKIPGFPKPTVPGHSGNVALARFGGTDVIALGGRSHFYEGCSMEEIAFPMRTLAALGVQAVLLTNAAGGIHPKFQPGDFMCLSDHINFMGVNPLRGFRRKGLTQFVDLSQVYDRALARLLNKAARRKRIRLHVGTYLAVSGPTYETPAEIRAFARLGADAVGMSTVPEAIAARECGLRVAALSCITNLTAGRTSRPLSHAEVLATGKRVRAQAAELLKEFFQLYTAGNS